LPEQHFPELEQLMLHRLAELDALIRKAEASHDWTGVYPAIHYFCATDLSAFYFDIRKDSLYCDRPDAEKRRACRSVLDILHHCLTAWLAPALPFTAEEAYCARHGDDGSVHLTLFPEIPGHWRNDALAEKWSKIREIRTGVTGAIEAMRREKTIGSSLQAAALLPAAAGELLSAQDWADVSITSNVEFGSMTGAAEAGAAEAPGEKCERCWRVLPEVGSAPAHPTLCLRCCEAVG
jgi:isoleucyl-tRNA synthetase